MSRPYSRTHSRFSGLQTKILALVLIPIVLVTVALVSSSALDKKAATEDTLAEQNQQLMEARKNKVKSLVESAYSTVKPIINNPALSRDAKQDRVSALLQNARFDGDNYIWAYDYDGVVTVLGDDAQQLGDDHYARQSDDGTYIVQGMIDAGRSGKGFYRYDWDYPGTHDPQTKVSYVIDMPDLGWVMGAGAYMVDIDETMAAVREEALGELKTGITKSVLLGAGVLVVAGLIVAWLVRRLVRPINHTAEAMRDIAQGAR